VISKPAILRFSERHRDALVPLLNWYRITKRADWGSPVDVRKDFAHADVVGRRTVFNIHGNDYRLIARVNYKARRVYILTSSPTPSTARETGNDEYDTGVEIKDSVYAKLGEVSAPADSLRSRARTPGGDAPEVGRARGTSAVSAS